MFSDPQKTGRTLGKACMSSFGKDLVREAVFQKAYGEKPHYDVLRTYDESAFESEKPKPKVQFEKGDRIRLHGLTSPAGRKMNGVSSVNQ